MLTEIGLAAGMLGKIYDLATGGKKDKASEAAGDGGAFAALMGQVSGQAGIGITSLGGAKAEDGGLSEIAGTKGMDAQAMDAWQYLKDMTEGGLEGAMRTAMQKLRDKIMEEMGVSKEELAAMDPAARGAMEAKIEEEIQKRIEAAMGADGVVTAEENLVGAKLMEMAKAYKNDVPTV